MYYSWAPFNREPTLGRRISPIRTGPVNPRGPVIPNKQNKLELSGLLRMEQMLRRRPSCTLQISNMMMGYS
jgi:hypothetical protein